MGGYLAVIKRYMGKDKQRREAANINIAPVLLPFLMSQTPKNAACIVASTVNSKKR